MESAVQYFNILKFHDDIIVTKMEPAMYFLFVIVTYCIYKEWLTFNKKENWQNNDILPFIRLDLRFRINMNKHT